MDIFKRVPELIYLDTYLRFSYALSLLVKNIFNSITVFLKTFKLFLFFLGFLKSFVFYIMSSKFNLY